ncbi:hypothetical protein GVv1_29550 [Enterobacter pseudoroggenkampii]
MSNTLTGTDKSVILLMTIGEDRAAEVFKHLSQREVQILSAAMANVRQISNKQLTEVLAEFEQEAEQFAALNINANDYLRSVLVKALGEERASSLLEDILENPRYRQRYRNAQLYGTTECRRPYSRRAPADYRHHPCPP